MLCVTLSTFSDYIICVHSILYIYIYISIHKVCFGPRAPDAQGVRGLPGSKCCYLLHMAARAWPGAADGSKWLLEPAREPQMARNGRSSPPGAADGLKWPLEPAPEPQNTRKVPLESAPEPQNARQMSLEPPRRRRMLDGCRSSLPRSRSMLKKCRSSPQPGGAFVSYARNGRSKNAASCSSIIGINFARLHLASCMLCMGSHKYM